MDGDVSGSTFLLEERRRRGVSIRAGLIWRPRPGWKWVDVAAANGGLVVRLLESCRPLDDLRKELELLQRKSVHDRIAHVLARRTTVIRFGMQAKMAHPARCKAMLECHGCDWAMPPSYMRWHQ